MSLVAKGELSGKLAREIFPKMAETGDSAPVIMEREGLKQISDSGALAKIVDEVIAANPKQVAEYKSGQGGGAEVPGRPGDESQPRPGQPGGGERAVRGKAEVGGEARRPVSC